MTVVASSVVALQLLRTYECPHCGFEQRRLLAEEGRSIRCSNCLKSFDPSTNQPEKSGKRPARRRKKR